MKIELEKLWWVWEAGDPAELFVADGEIDAQKKFVARNYSPDKAIVEWVGSEYKETHDDELVVELRAQKAGINSEGHIGNVGEPTRQWMRIRYRPD